MADYDIGLLRPGANAGVGVEPAMILAHAISRGSTVAGELAWAWAAVEREGLLGRFLHWNGVSGIEAGTFAELIASDDLIDAIIAYPNLWTRAEFRAALADSADGMAALCASATALATLNAYDTARAAMISTPTARMAWWNSDTALSFVAGSSGMRATMTAAGEIATASGTLGGTISFAGVLPGDNYILLGVSQTGTVTDTLTFTTRRSGSSRPVSGSVGGSTGTAAAALLLAAPIEPPITCNTPSDGGNVYVRVLRCDAV